MVSGPNSVGSPIRRFQANRPETAKTEALATSPPLIQTGTVQQASGTLLIGTAPLVQDGFATASRSAYSEAANAAVAEGQRAPITAAQKQVAESIESQGLAQLLGAVKKKAPGNNLRGENRPAASVATPVSRGGTQGTAETRPAGPSPSIEKLNGDQAKNLALDPAALSKLSTADKAKLLEKTGDPKARLSILENAKDKKEYDALVTALGPKKLEAIGGDDKIKAAVKQLDGQWQARGNAEAAAGIARLEQASSPEEARQIAQSLGPDFKNQVQDKQLLGRLEAVAQRHGLPELGYGLPPEKVVELRAKIGKAESHEDHVAIARDKDALAVASPADKARILSDLQKGWTKAADEEAIVKVLGSIKSKSEFDQVLALGGGQRALDIGNGELRQKANEIAGGWGRVDLATDKTVAKQFENILADPQKNAQLAATRPPTPGEVSQVGGPLPAGATGQSDPLLAQAGQALGQVKQGIQQKAFDINYDPGTRTELILEQRRRELGGKPPLDWTKLTSEAEKISSEAEQKVRAEKNIPPDKPVSKEDKQAYIEKNIDSLRKQYGLSEQTAKQLVTQRLGSIYAEGSQQLGAFSEQAVGPLKKQLAELEKTDAGKNSAEAKQLREKIGQFEKTVGPYASHLGQVGETYQKLFPIPPSPLESFVSVFTKIVDIGAALASVIPGVGAAISGTYFGIKTIVSAAQGNLLGAFGSLASALPGIGGAVGGAIGQGLSIAGQAAQTGLGLGKGIADGNLLGVVGGLASAAGGLGNVGGAAGQVASQVKQGLDAAKTVGGVVQGVAKGDLGGALGAVGGLAGQVGSAAGAGSEVAQIAGYAQKAAALTDGIRRGDLGALAGAASSLAGPLANDPAVQNIVKNPIVQDAASAVQGAAPFLDALTKGGLGKALGTAAEQVGALQGPGTQNAAGWLNDGARVLDALRSGDYAKALGGTTTALQSLGASPEASPLAAALQPLPEFITALGKRDALALARTLSGGGGQPGLLKTLANGTLSKALSGLGERAGQTQSSSQLQHAIELAQAGKRFAAGLADGQLIQSLSQTAAGNTALGPSLPSLNQVLSSAAPLLQVAGRGDFHTAIGHLSGHRGTASVAEKLGLLEPLVDLARGGTLSNLETAHAHLQHLHRTARQTRELEKLEAALREVERQFGKDPVGLSRQLLAKAGHQHRG